MNVFESILAAKLFRLTQPTRNFSPDLDRMWMESHIMRRIPSDQRSPITMLSGVFRGSVSTTFHPFAIAFSERGGQRHSSIAQFAYIDTRLSKKATALLSVIDYLVSINELPIGALEDHMARINEVDGSSDSRDARREAVEGYFEFCRDAMDDLPYDLAQQAQRLAA